MNEWPVFYDHLMSIQNHSKSFSQSQKPFDMDDSTTNCHRNEVFHGVSLFFFPWILPQHRDILVDFAARCPLRLCDRRSWDHQLTFTPPRLAMLLSLSLRDFPSRMTSESIWESHEKSMGRLYPLISYDKFWPSHLCMNIINNNKMVGPWYRCRYPNFQPYPLHFAGSTS